LPSAEKPVVHKVAEPAPSPGAPIHSIETKPAPPPVPAKGAETLVALSTPSAPRSSEPAAASQKSAHAAAPKTEAVAPTSEPQALFFKGPERPPPQASHKFIWLTLGLAVCAATGGGLTWVRLNRTRQVALALPVKKQSDDDVDLPREFKVKERRAFVEEEPATTEKT
jgi:hypothetical protein